MSKSLVVSAAEANRSFSKLLRAVKEGANVTVTSHGEPVAEIVPISRDKVEEDRRQMQEAFAEMQKRWASTEPLVIGPWSRDDLYDRDW
jgi:prevent-host-death family protein